MVDQRIEPEAKFNYAEKLWGWGWGWGECLTGQWIRLCLIIYKQASFHWVCPEMREVTPLLVTSCV